MLPTVNRPDPNQTNAIALRVSTPRPHKFNAHPDQTNAINLRHDHINLTQEKTEVYALLTSYTAVTQNVMVAAPFKLNKKTKTKGKYGTTLLIEWRKTEFLAQPHALRPSAQIG